MKQQIELLKKVKAIPKPSEILKEAHVKGVKKCKNSFKIGDSYCARGILIKEFGESRGNKVNPYYVNNLMLDYGDAFEIEKELFSDNLYNKKPEELTSDEKDKIHEILTKLSRFNDSSDKITFLDCAKELEKVGL
jgi:hypothetical protein